MELDSASRGAVLDQAAVVSAAEKTAHAEDNAIFNGFKAGGIESIPTASHPAIDQAETQQEVERSRTPAHLRANGKGGTLVFGAEELVDGGQGVHVVPPPPGCGPLEHPEEGAQEEAE
jgi:hypothetical protein